MSELTRLRVESGVAPRPIVVVGHPELAERVQLLLNGASAKQPDETQPPARVLCVPSFLSALGEAARTDLAAVLGPVRSLSG
ncbi:MAG: hypothetical protein AAF086_05235, partial [Planctomycetota bacterium]